MRYVTIPACSAEGARTSLENGDILVSITADIGIIGYVDSSLQKPAYINQHIALIRLRSPDIYPQFVGYFVASAPVQNFFRAITDAGAKAGINLPTVRSIPFALPPNLPEQQLISQALSEVQSTCEAFERLIAKKRDLKQATMQELLRPKHDWATCTLGDLLEIKHGKSQWDVADPNGSIPILASGGQLGWARQALYDKPSVLIGRKGTIDRPQYVDRPFWTVDTLFYSVILGENCAKYLFYQFCLISWREYNEGSGVPSLNASTIEAIDLAVPLPGEQEHIATVLTGMDAEIAALEVRLAKYQKIKQGMTQNLLTGAIRLV